MAPYMNPNLLDHAEGLEQRIIELGAQINRLDANRATRQEADRLRRWRRDLVNELAKTSKRLTEAPTLGGVRIRGARAVGRTPYAA